MNYGHIEVVYLNPGVSDHPPILLKCNFAAQQQNLNPRPFKIYQTVLHHPIFSGIVKEVWAHDYRDARMSKTWQKLKRLNEALRDLNTYMASYQQKLDQARQKLELAQSNISLQPLCQIFIEQEKAALIEVERWSNVEEHVLRQKSRVIWIQYGDANIRYFHAQWKMRTSANTINSIHNDAGIKIIELKQKQQLELIKEVAAEEIFTPVKSMPTDKAPGVVGFPIEFITQHWEEAFMNFSKASGLQANADKISIYLTGISANMKEDILQELGYNEGTLPFQYLGVPLASRKLSINQCLIPVEKITARISCRTSNMLSYSGRLQLIKSVIFGVQSYCAQIFLLPKKVLKMIETTYRTFLWTGKAEALEKHLWAITKKKDFLWNSWIHAYYIKNHNVDIMSIPKNAAWVVRKILKLKKLILDLPTNQGDLTSRLMQLQSTDGRFGIKMLYQMQLPHIQKVHWKSLILHPHIHPRHKFNLLLVVQGRLPTVEKLQKIGIQIPQACVFCDLVDEHFEHLFFGCGYNKNILQRLLNWLGCPRQINTWQEEVKWATTYAKKKKGFGTIVSAVFGMMVYLIWRDINKIRFQSGSCPRIECVEKLQSIYTLEAAHISAGRSIRRH
ncbi:uncharacterized protein LOC142178139 [Nicotiana tabacum]|uniref:Uncharacterized protein LOC142178139 n=1 Tax=Nicotiana tabacum TaxID=4097 RepID=A0AC58U287_TOBAC